MKFIKPNSVSGEILNLLDEAKVKVVIVSPYCKFDKWYRLVNKIKDLKNRNVAVEFYVREGEIESKIQVKNIGIEPICIPNLHCKLYFNEKIAIITSMNLLLSSEINSLELGYRTETIEEYNELINFYNTYLNKSITIEEKIIQESQYDDYNWIDNLQEVLTQNFGRCKIYYDKNNVFTIRTKSNTYTSFIWSNKNINTLRISAVLSGDEFEYADSFLQNKSFTDFEIELNEGGKGYYDTAWASSVENLKSSNIEEIKDVESKTIFKQIFEFIVIIEDLKDNCYANRKVK